ncbi:NAD(P)-binding domain-containing protein [Aquincola tertiaricarbonis]|uniref:NAD(P)-binding domain-containing protein n=1 Tax=Aquincola tertiaricarbonis TaxID=391953 RepID=UPI000615404D|nr:NAD(P)-binding domain-containing protein [Aquincola tertiaricarbonis]
MNIAIVGLGEVGRCYAAPLDAAGHRLLLCEAHVSDAARRLAESLGLTIRERAGDWLSDADLVLSCVTGTTALPVLQQILPFLRKGATVADFTTASPAVKRQGAALAKAAGVEFVDTAIMGAISLNLVRTPLLVAGTGTSKLKDALEHAGGKVQVIEGGSAGDAMSLKILRSVFTKGMEALCVELLMSAEKQGVRGKLYEQLSDIDNTPLRSFIDMLVRTHVIHAKRRAHEVHDAQAELVAQGLPSVVLRGVEQRFLDTAAALEVQPLPSDAPSVDQALDWLLANRPAAASAA